MKREKVEKILQKYAQFVYFDKSNILIELEDIKEMAQACGYEYELFRQAEIASAQGLKFESIDKGEKALDVARKSNNEFVIYEVLMFLGIKYRAAGQIEEAFKRYIHSLKYKTSPRVYNNIADIYMIIGDYDEAYTYLNRALNMVVNKPNRTFLEERIMNIIYTNLSEVDIHIGKLVEAEESAQVCIALSKKTGDQFAMGYGLELMGAIKSESGYYKEAIDFYQEAYELYLNCDQHSQRQVLIYIDENLRSQGNCYFLWGKHKQALEKLTGIKNLVKFDFKLFIENYKALGDMDKTFEYYERFVRFIEDEEKSNKTNQIENFKSRVTMLEAEKKANEYELLYKNTKSISDIGKQIIASEKLDDVLVAIYSHIDKIMNFNTLALASISEDRIMYNWVLENHKPMDRIEVDLNSKNSFSAWVARNRKAIRINDAMTSEELKKYKENAEGIDYGQTMDSMIICPIVMKNEIYGLINVQSSDSFQYNEYDLEVVNMLASFIAVAMKNWEDTKLLVDVNGKLEKLSKTDALTGISNRHVLSEIVEDIFNSKGDSKGKISVVMIDIDHFKEYNDTYGHVDGDRCLINVVNELRKKLDEGDNRLFRYGGDEFVAILPSIEPDEVYALLFEVKKGIEALMIENKHSKVADYVTCSFGYTTVEKGAYEYQRAFYLADEALYQAKASGKNCIAANIENN